tara:strand:- start:1009 stop:1662 length:654 start_codon:yes stop_codon:yes gene_type:complete
MNKEIINRILSSIILIPLAFFFIIKGSFFFSFFILICFLITSYEWHMLSKKKDYYLIGYIFLIISFYSTYDLRNHFEGEIFVFIFVILICISTDIGGYVFGKIFKGPKLLKKISPKKTFSGMIGGYFLSILVIYIYFYYYYILYPGYVEPIFNYQIFIKILLFSTVSQIGDIIISYFKRLSKVKDTGKILPGHGGILDRIDGMIFTFPVAYLIYVIL